MFSFALIAFLLIGLILAVAVFFVLKSGEKGTTKLGGLAGCAVAFALIVIAGMGAFGCIVVALINAPDEFVRHGPVKSFELELGPEKDGEGWKTVAPSTLDSTDSAQPDAAEGTSESEAWKLDAAKHPLRFRILLRDASFTTHVVRWLRANLEGEFAISVATKTEANGTEITRIEIGLPLDRKERRELEEAIRRLKKAEPDLELPARAKLEFRDEKD